jgi:hypothetical protein
MRARIAETVGSTTRRWNLTKALLALWVVACLACNKKSDDASNELAASAAAVNVATPAGTAAVAPGAVTVTQGQGTAARAVVVGGHAGGGVQVQAGGKKIEVGPNGQVDISGLTGLAAKAAAGVPGGAAPNPAPAANLAAAPKTGPCAQLAAKCPKCTLPLLKQTCNLAVSSGDPASCQNGLNDHDVQSNCK